jgi:RNA polymerase sigma-70 factor (sigma-E family)
VLSHLYRQVTETQEQQFAAGYDLQAGLGRYRGWLRGQAGDGQPGDGQVGDGQPGHGQPGDGQVGDGQPGHEEPGHEEPGTVKPDAFLAAAPAEQAEWSPELAVIELYSVHYQSLVRLAAMLVRDTQTAEEVVQDAFIAMHDGWDRLRDTEKALAYMRQAVVNRSRSVLRHRVVVEKNQPKPPPDMPSAEHGALALLERSAVIAALRDLPERQREAIVLRYYADLSEADIAVAMRISRGAVKSHTSRAMAALRAALEQDA